MKKWPQEVVDWLSKHTAGKTTKELTQQINQQGFDQKYGMVFSEPDIKRAKSRYGFKSGVDCRFQRGSIPPNKGKKMTPEQYKKCKATMFRRGNIPANLMQVGDVTHTTDGYLIKKVKNTGTQWERFELVHRSVWEKHNGTIPSGKRIIFLDGNKDNCSIENLMLITDEENLEMNRSKLRSTIPEHTRTGVLITKLKVTARTRKRGRK